MIDEYIDTLKLRLNGCHVVDDFQSHFLLSKPILIKISLKVVLKDPNVN